MSKTIPQVTFKFYKNKFSLYSFVSVFHAHIYVIDLKVKTWTMENGIAIEK